MHPDLEMEWSLFAAKIDRKPGLTWAAFGKAKLRLSELKWTFQSENLRAMCVTFELGTSLRLQKKKNLLIN